MEEVQAVQTEPVAVQQAEQLPTNGASEPSPELQIPPEPVDTGITTETQASEPIAADAGTHQDIGNAEPATNDTTSEVPYTEAPNPAQTELAAPRPAQSFAMPSGPDYQALLKSLTTPSAPAASEAPSYIPLDDTREPQVAAPSNPSGPSGLPSRPPPQAPSARNRTQQHGTNPGSIGSVRSNGLPSAPLSGVPPGSPSEGSMNGNAAGHRNARPGYDDSDERWSQDIQRQFDAFLDQERHFVTEGDWEQFPYGSRLFVGKSSLVHTAEPSPGPMDADSFSGNLSSERVTKRDVFHVFHKYGSLAQISIKQAYGFVQFIHEADCARALAAEQGRTIRGKKVNLEISKPQKNKAGGGRRRSRSPERAGGGVDRYTGGRRRDEYRPGRSPSPNRRRDRSRDRHGRYRSRSRSPRRRSDRYRSPSPRRDEDDDLPLPRRAPRDVPDVQIVADDNLNREFIQWVERGVSSRGVKVDVLILSPRLSEAAVIKRQILEGVVAVLRLSLANQQSGKVPLQIFDRRGGSDIRFEEYADLDPNVAGELVNRAKTANQPTYGYGYGGSNNAPPPQPQQPQQQSFSQPAAPPNLGALAGMNPNDLQKVIAAMQQSGQPMPPGMPGGYGQAPPSQQDSLAALRNNPALAGLLGGQPGQQAASQGGGQPGADINGILAKLGQFRR